MPQYSVINPTRLVNGQTEDVSDVLSNFQQIATIINALKDDNIDPAAALAISKFAGYPADLVQSIRGDGSWQKNVSYNAAQTVSGANTDLAWPGGGAITTLMVIGTGGGSLRSLGAPVIGQGARVVIRNGSTSNVTVIHGSVAGTGKALYLTGSSDTVLRPEDRMTFDYDGSEWMQTGINAGLYSDYAPTWGSDGTQPALGNGTLTGRFCQIGKNVHYFGQLVMGSTTTFGTGNYTISLPINRSSAGNFSRRINGVVEMFDTSANAGGLGWAETAAQTTAFNIIHSPVYLGAGRGGVQNNAPWTWAQGDFINWNLMYEGV